MNLATHLLLFRNKFNKLKNTGTQLLDSIDHITVKVLKHCIFALKREESNVVIYVITLLNLYTTNGLSILLHAIISS